MLGTTSAAAGILSPYFMIGKDILGANDRINCAIAGVRSRGKALAAAINLQKNTKVLSEVVIKGRKIKEFELKNSGFHFTGNFLNGISLQDNMINALTISNKIIENIKS